MLCAGGLLVAGETILRVRLEGWWFVFYWMGCLGFTLLAMLTALLDWWIIRERSREEQRELLRRTMGDIGREGSGGKGGSAEFER